MSPKTYKIIRKFVRHMCVTWKNKLLAMLLFACGVMGIILLSDGTMMVLALIFGLPLFITSKRIVC